MTRKVSVAGALVAATTHMPAGGTLASTHWNARRTAPGGGGTGGGPAFVGVRWHRVFGYEAEGHTIPIPYSDATLDAWAADFDDIAFQTGYTGQGVPTSPHIDGPGCDRMRVVNPAIRLLNYINGGLLAKTTTTVMYPVGSLAAGDAIPEAWYAHDSTGARIGSSYGGSSTRWLMEPSNADWRAYIAKLCRVSYDLTRSDGVFPDVLGLSSGMNPMVPGTSTPYTGTTFMAQTRKAGAAIKAALPAGALVVPNGLKNGSPYFSFAHTLLEGEGAVLDGGMTETFSRDPAAAANRSQANLLQDMNVLDDVARVKGKWAIACVKVWNPATDPSGTFGRFGFGLFMLGEPTPAAGARGKNTMLYSQGQPTDMDVYTWHSRTNYGKPLADKVLVASGVWTRNFDFYTLAVNTAPSTWVGPVAGVTVTLPTCTAQWIAK